MTKQEDENDDGKSYQYNSIHVKKHVMFKGEIIEFYMKKMKRMCDRKEYLPLGQNFHNF